MSSSKPSPNEKPKQNRSDLNNDPNNWIGYGQRSIDDMAMAWMTYVNLTEDEFQQAVAERKAKTKPIRSEQRSEQLDRLRPALHRRHGHGVDDLCQFDGR